MSVPSDRTDDDLDDDPPEPVPLDDHGKRLMSSSHTKCDVCPGSRLRGALTMLARGTGDAGAATGAAAHGEGRTAAGGLARRAPVPVTLITGFLGAGKVRPAARAECAAASCRALAHAPVALLHMHPSALQTPCPPCPPTRLNAHQTTLVRHILTARHGRRIAVILNEFGAPGDRGGASREVRGLKGGQGDGGGRRSAGVGENTQLEHTERLFQKFTTPSSPPPPHPEQAARATSRPRLCAARTGATRRCRSGLSSPTGASAAA